MSTTDLILCFDTTCSMTPCLNTVKQHVKDMVTEILSKMDTIRIGIYAHGDYCDEKSSYLFREISFTRDTEALCDFVTNKATPTGGGDFPECYELCFHNANKSFANSTATNKVLIMIGDATPHEKNDNPDKLDWRKEVRDLQKKNVQIYGVRCLNHGGSEEYFNELEKISAGLHVNLQDIELVVDIMYIICVKEETQKFVKERFTKMIADGRMTTEIANMIDRIAIH